MKRLLGGVGGLVLMVGAALGAPGIGGIGGGVGSAEATVTYMNFTHSVSGCDTMIWYVDGVYRTTTTICPDVEE